MWRPPWATFPFSQSPLKPRFLSSGSTRSAATSRPPPNFPPRSKSAFPRLTNVSDQTQSDKMNSTARLGEQFLESSLCLHWQQGRYANGTLRKQFTKSIVQFILSFSRSPCTNSSESRLSLAFRLVLLLLLLRHGGVPLVHHQRLRRHQDLPDPLPQRGGPPRERRKLQGPRRR